MAFLGHEPKLEITYECWNRMGYKLLDQKTRWGKLGEGTRKKLQNFISDDHFRFTTHFMKVNVTEVLRQQ